MNLNKLTKAQLIEMIKSMQDERIHAQRKDVQAVTVVQVQSKTHAEIMAVRMAAAKAAAMSTGRAVKA